MLFLNSILAAVFTVRITQSPVIPRVAPRGDETPELLFRE